MSAFSGPFLVQDFVLLAPGISCLCSCAVSCIAGLNRAQIKGKHKESAVQLHKQQAQIH